MAAVVTQPGRRRGRSKGPSPSPVAAAAAARGIPDELVLTPEKARDVSLDASVGNAIPSVGCRRESSHVGCRRDSSSGCVGFGRTCA